MARRSIILEPEENPQPARKGGNDWDLCTKEFIDSMTLRNLSWYTKRHHKENLSCMKRLLTSIIWIPVVQPHYIQGIFF
ncbi:MAG: hypothetical protein APF84_13690 [Gracilibacter sp. BRH_c7a]|nr:MAG: hypothetical protein APF84_13690 [Gracilibacter sp. BRH_c7a]